MNQDIVLASNFMPAMGIQEAIQRRQAIVEFTRQLMVEGTDFGKIPGTGDKPTLLKPGAEKLCTLFGLAARFELMRSVEDWTGKDHDDEPFLYFVYSCSLYRNEALIAQGEGSCNSWEKKYRYRDSQRVCPSCGKAAIIKGKVEYGGGFLCFVRKGGCGAKFADNAPEIVNQVTGQVPNPDVADLVNTIQKMAQKRALVAATLLAVNASEFFTQDIEDMAGLSDGPIIENAPPQKQAPPAQPKKETQPQVDPLTKGLYTNTSRLHPDTVIKWTALVEKAKAANAGLNYDLDDSDTAEVMADRVQAVKNAIAAASNPQPA